MKILMIFLCLLPFASSASTLHLAEILEKGYHFSAVQYAAFNEPESAKGKDTEEYLKSILKDAQLEIDNNYVLLRNTDLSDNLSQVDTSIVGSTVKLENEKNVLDLDLAKKCAERSMPQIKLIMFHQSMHSLELSQNLESTLRMERGLVKDMRLGLVCGAYLGPFGEIQAGDLVEEFKILSLIARENQKDIFRFFKLHGLYLESKTPMAMELLKYLKTKILVGSYKKQSMNELNLSEVKDEFKARILNSSLRMNSESITFDSSQSGIMREIEEAYTKVAHELL